ncbi:MAG: rhamnosidase [Puniceicoccaceae bacterium]|nr:MAG: rhamnosidase [Puniceicoccaceae bacterium]
MTTNAPPAPHSLVVGEGFVDPLGFHDARPTFSWKLPEGARRQTAFRLEILSGDDRRDTGWIGSDQSTFVPAPGLPFSSRQQATWRVRFQDEAGRKSPWSIPARFELGLLSASDWSAQWIRPAGDAPQDREPVGLLRRSFPLSGLADLRHARLYVTARGLFRLQLNDCRIGDDHFANGFTAYQKRLHTLTYDVSTLLRVGENQLEALLGTGWFAGRLPFQAKTRGPYGLHPELLLQLEVTRADGARETVVSDDQWEGSFDIPVRTSSLYDGEDYDARHTAKHWAPVHSTADLGPAVLVPKPFAPIRAVQSLAARTVAEPAPGRFVFDFGQNIVGHVRIRLPARKDRTLSLRFAEMLQPDGTLYTENYRTARSTDTYTPDRDCLLEWEPVFTFHGFRYVEISGLPDGVRPAPDSVTGVVLQTDLRPIGRFASSHPKLNQLQSNIIWGWRGNSLDIPTDCPQRDERLGWTGDAQVFCATSLFNQDCHSFWKSWLATMRDEQDPDGVVPDIIPAAAVTWRNRSPGWLDAATFIPWDVFVRTGDLSILSENYRMMEKLVAWYRSQSVDGLLPNIKGYGDWLQPYRQTPTDPDVWMGDRVGDTPFPLLGAAFYARSAQVLAQTAQVLGRDDNARCYRDEAGFVAAAFSRAYFDANGRLRIAPETQTAYALAIAFDLLPTALRASAGARLAALVREAGGHLRTGFLGTPHLLAALDQTGNSDLAAEILFKETYPGWFYSINQGATTLWERWNSYSHEEGFGDAGMNSFNHYAYGAVGQWLYERVAGLAPDPAHPGYRHFFVRPLILAQLDHAEAELDTPHGRAAVRWEKMGDRLLLEVTVPPTATATVTAPGSKEGRAVPPGQHRFEHHRHA